MTTYAKARKRAKFASTKAGKIILAAENAALMTNGVVKFAAVGTALKMNHDMQKAIGSGAAAAQQHLSTLAEREADTEIGKLAEHIAGDIFKQSLADTMKFTQNQRYAAQMGAFADVADAADAGLDFTA